MPHGRLEKLPYPLAFSAVQNRMRFMFATLGTAALSRTHRSRRGLHGVVAAFTLSVLSSVFVLDS